MHLCWVEVQMRDDLLGLEHPSRDRWTFIEAVDDEPFEIHTIINTNFD